MHDKHSKGEEMKRQGLSGIIVLSLLIGSTVPFAQAASRYSVANGNWNSTSTWSATSGGAPGASYPVAGDNVTIENNYTVTVTANAACATMTIASGSQLTVNANFTMTFTGAVTVNGTWLSQSTGAVSGGTITFASGSVYNHNVNGGTIPTATWSSGSNCNLTGLTATMPTITAGTAFWNLTFNSPGQTAVFNIGANSFSVTGTFSLTNTNSYQISMNFTPFNVNNFTINGGNWILGGAATARVMNVSGNFTLSSGTLTLPAGASASANQTINVTGDVSITGGTLDLSSSTYTTPGNGILNVAGNFSFTGGTITETGNATADAINFNGTGTQTFTSGGTLSNTVNFSIANGATVDFGTSVISSGSNGTFTVSSGGSLITANTAGITTTGATGSIQVTGTRTYTSGANYTYNGTANQATGNGLAQNTPANVTIDIPGNTVTLSATGTISGNLTVSSGTFDLSTFTINRSAAGGTLTVSNGATLSIGGTGTLPSNYSTHSIGATSTINYAGTTQTVAVLNSSQNYGNLTISGSGTKTLAGSETVSGTLTISAGTLADGGFTLSVNGNIANSASHTGAGKISLTGGSGTHTLSGGGSYTNLELNDANGATLSSNLTINGTLTFTSGEITLGSNNLTIGSSGSISGGSSSSYIVTNSTGVLTRNGVGASNVAFPVGTSSTYNPVTINNAGTPDNFSVNLKSSFDHAPNNANYVNCQWTITEAGTGGNATITLQWNTTDEHTGFNRANPIYIGRWNGTQWVQTSASLGGSGPYTATATNFTSFSPFGVGNDGALPIQLASFTASVIRDNEVEVAWRTVSETNNYGFEIYRNRGDAGVWAKIGFVQGHGTTLAPQSYTYADAGLSFGKYYYRIKQVDLDGKSQTFPEMSVTVGVGPDKFILAQNYPNPFNPSTQIEFVVPQSGFATMKLYNVLGQEVATLFEGNAEAGRIYTVRFSATGGSAFGGNASNLPSGLYFYTLTSAEKIETKRMILMK
jgi:hypothetical protein